MPNPFNRSGNKPVVVTQATNDPLGAIAIPKRDPSFLDRIRENRAISKAQRDILIRRVEGAHRVQLAEIDVIAEEAVSAAVTAARIRGTNIRAAIVADGANTIGALQSALVTQIQALGHELGNARYAGAHHNLQVRNERSGDILEQVQAGKLSPEDGANMVDLISALHVQVEDMVDLSYEGGRRNCIAAFELATKTAAEITHQTFQKKGE